MDLSGAYGCAPQDLSTLILEKNNASISPPRYEAKLQLSAQEGSDACSTRYYRIVSASGASRAIYPRPGLV